MSQDFSSQKSVSFWMADTTTDQKAGLNLKFGIFFFEKRSVTGTSETQ